MAASVELLHLITHHIVIYGVFYYGLYLFLRSVYRVLFHPLAKYPGPLFAKISPFWRTWAGLSKEAHLKYYELHQTYGPVVRDGPNSLSFSDYRAVKIIYGRGKDSFPRPNTFPTIGLNPEHPPIFFSVDARTHQVARRKVGGAYTMTSILTMEDQIDSMIEQLEQRLVEEAENDTVFDMSKWINFFTIDIISDLAFGEAFGCLKSGGDVNGIISGLQGGHLFSIMLTMFPAINNILFNSPVKNFIQLPDKEGIGMAIKTAHNIVSLRYKIPSEKRDLLNAIITSKDPDGTPIHPDQVRGEVIATLVAGGDTTAMSILGCFGFLLRNKRVLHLLREEIDTFYTKNMLRGDQLPPYAELAKLPYLTAVINETLRFSPSVGAAFTRITPTSGAEIIPGEYVPGGTEVGANNWVVGRAKELYGDDAEVFRPERWIENEEQAKRFKDYEFAFGHGARICIGRNLAFVELYKTIAIIVRKYDMEPVDMNHIWDEKLTLFLYKTNMMMKIRRRVL